MGLIKDTKATSAAADAARATREGRSVLLYRFNVPATSPGISGPVSGAAEVIEAIERHGWRLDTFAYDGVQSKNGAALLMFRRAAAPAAADQRGTHARADGYDSMYQ